MTAHEDFRTPYLLAMRLGGITTTEACELLDAYDRVRRAEVLEEAATALEEIHPAIYDDAGQRTADGLLRGAAHLRSLTTAPKES